MTLILVGVDQVRANVGRHLGYAPEIIVSQHQLDEFTHATGTPGHDGYMALSLSNLFLPKIVEIQGFEMGVNYGCEAVRFGSPVTAGARVRAGALLQSATDVPGGLQTLMVITVEILSAESTSGCACTIESLSRWY